MTARIDRPQTDVDRLCAITDAQLYAPTSNLNLSVDVYHINVEGAGDASVHYLVHQDVRYNLAFVLRAVLIDAGMPGDTEGAGAPKVKRFLNTIGPLYDFDKFQGGRPTALTWPAFDSIVITHWDRDHFGGIQPVLSDTLFNDFDAWKTANPKPTPTPSPTEVQKAADATALQTWQQNMGTWTSNYLSPFMKYQTTTAVPPVRGDRATTIMYMPYWGTGPSWGGTNQPSDWFAVSAGHVSRGTKGGFKGMGFDTNTAGKQNFWYPAYTGTALEQDQARRAEGPNISTRFLNFNAERMGASSGPEEQWVKKICRVRSGNANLLGTNLFTHWKPARAQALLMVNPMALALSHTTATSYTPGSTAVGADALQNGVTAAAANALAAQAHAIAQPVLLIVAANNERCGRDAAAGPAPVLDPKGEEAATEQETDLTNQDKFLNWAALHPPPAPTGTTSSSSTSSSSSSTATNDRLKVRNTKSGLPASTGFRANSKVVNKSTGTAEGELTNLVSIITLIVWTDGHISHYSAGDALWETEDSIVDWIQNGGGPFRSVRAMKLSHHGGNYSTPLDLVTKLKPRSIITPAAMNDHGHPTYELLLYLNRWFRTTNRIVPSGTKPGKLLHPLGYPYYIALPPDEGEEEEDAPADDTTMGGGSSVPTGGDSGTSGTGSSSSGTHTASPSSTSGDGSSSSADTSAVVRRPRVARLLTKIDLKYVAYGGKVKLFGSLLSDDTTAEKLSYITQLNTLEQNLPPKSRAVARFKRLEAALEASTLVPVAQLNVKRNFTLKGTEMAMKVVADWLPETYPGVSTMDTSLLTILPGNEKVQYVKIHCRSWDSTRRASDLEPRLDGYTETRTVTFDASATVGTAKKRKAGKKRSSEDEEGTTRELEKDQGALDLLNAIPESDLDNYQRLRKRTLTRNIEKNCGVLRVIQSGEVVTKKRGRDGSAVNNRVFHRKVTVSNRVAGPHVASAAVDAHTAAPHSAAVTAAANSSPWLLVAASRTAAMASPLSPRLVEISDDSSDYEAFLLWIKENAFIVDGNGAATGSNSFRSYLFGALGLDSTSNPAPTLQTVFGADGTGQISDGLWTGLQLSCTQAGHNLKFDTASAKQYFALTLLRLKSSNPKYQFPDSGVEAQISTLIFGLANADAKPDWNFTQVLQWLDLIADNETTDAISALEDFLGTGVGFKLLRGAIYFAPDVNYGIVQRMEWELDAAKVTNWVNTGFLKTSNAGAEITLQNPILVGRKTTRQTDTSAGDLFIDACEILISLQLLRTVDGKSETMTTTIEVDLEEGSSSLTISLLPENGDLADLLSWIMNLMGQEADQTIADITDWIPGHDKINVRRIQLITTKGGIQSFSVEVQWLPGWKDGDGADAAEVPLLLVYRWTKSMKPNPHTISAQVWFEASLIAHPLVTPAEISPFYEESRVIRPTVSPPASVHLQSLMPGSYKLPEELDLEIAELMISLEGKTVSFSGILQASEDDGQDEGFGIRLQQVTLKASYERGDDPPVSTPGTAPKPKPGDSSYSLFMEAIIDITPGSADDGGTGGDGTNADTVAPDDNETDLTVITASIELVSKGTSKVCRLHGSVTDLNLGMLGRFFPADDRIVVTDILGHLTLESLVMDYEYQATGKVSSFDMKGVLIIGPCELDLKFHRDQDGWEFDSLFKARDGTEPTVKDLLAEILADDDEALSNVPDFITKLSLAGDDAFASFKLASVEASEVPEGATPSQPAEGETDPTYFMMDLTLRLPVPGGAGIEFSFIQLTEKPPRAGGSTKPAAPTGGMRSKTKRIIRVAIVDLPWHKIPNPPVVGKIDPLFDQLQFLWVQDRVSNEGITRGEVAALEGFSELLFKEMTPEPKRTPLNPVILAGMHFCIADSSQLLLDYVFNKPKPTASPKTGAGTALVKSGPALDVKQPAAGTPQNSPSGEGTSTGELSKKVGPLTVSNVGLRFENNVLMVFLDIEAHLGPVRVMLLGFGIGIDLTSVNFQKPEDIELKFQLKGMGISFQQPPVGLAGMFKDASNATQRLYMGGIAVTFEPYSFMAVGEYGEISRNGVDMTDGTFKTLFIFAKLEGPLIELEFITIGGITLGFGYNSNLRFPQIEDVPTFPFIANTTGGPDADPLQVMNALVGAADSYVKPQEDSYWIAAGLQAKALQMLDVSAVVVLEFSPYVNLGIFAKAIAQMPPEPTPRIACFLYVELGIMCTVDFHAGAFKVEAQLSPNSFVIHPSCHLTGGFAFCYWFPPSDYSGDFVFSVGGYHPSFKPPLHYPLVPRLAITWALGPVSIRGEAYFAITPKCCMGGGRLDAVFDAGLLSAYFTAYADFLIVYNPFYFVGDVGVAVGVRFELHLLFVTIHISVSLGARLHLKGPKFGGVAHVDFWVFGFDIPIGEQSDRPPARVLKDFLDLLLQVPDPDSMAQAAITDGSTLGGNVDKLHVMSVEAGRYPNKAGASDAQSGPGAVWEVKRAGFQFRIQSRVPLQSITQPPVSEKESANVVSSPGAFYAKPMHIVDNLVSEMTVTVGKREKDSHGVVKFEMETFTPSPIVKSVPKAMWDLYSDGQDPTSRQADTSQLVSNSDGGTLDLLMGATFAAPPPYRSQDKVLKFNILLSNSLDVFTEEDLIRVPPAIPILPAAVRPAQTTARSRQPATGAIQWVVVKSAWETKTQTKLWDNDAKDDVSVVDSAINMWTQALGWSTGDDQLKSTLGSEDETFLWEQFNQLYMTAPLIAASA